ncbi:MAG TPA: diguanylate cyclase [Thermoleophilaceae bacterium]
MEPLERRLSSFSKWALIVLAFALAVLTAHNGLRMPWPAVPPASWWEWLYDAIEFGAVAVCVARAVARRSERFAWLSIALGLLSFSVADVYWTLVYQNADNVPYPSINDAMYLATYPFLYIGVGLLLRARVKSLPAGMWLDGLIGGLAVAAVGAALIFGKVVASTGGAPLTVATNLAYPLFDILLLGIVVGVLTATGWTLRGGWVLIGVGLAVFAVVDSIYLYQVALGTYVEDKLLDVGWPATMVLIAVAAWQRPARAARVQLEGWATFAVPVIAAITCLGLEFRDHYKHINVAALWLATACLLAVVARLAMSFRQNLRMLRKSQEEAVTDSLTGLSNRRGLVAEIEERLAEERPFTLAIYDLDGFKGYNDSFGHAAGDALLARMGRRLRASLPTGATGFRMGGDEFCVVASGGGRSAREAVGLGANCLTEVGEGFSIGCSHGSVTVPDEAPDGQQALVIADQRMYDHKGQGRPTPAVESKRVLLHALAERSGDLSVHVSDVGDLVEALGRELQLDHAQLVVLRQAAELHDVGKLAIPDSILDKPGPLDADEWAFMRRHTLIGERIVASAVSLRDAAPIVRATHERWDGAGYPDGTSGEQIPLAARIIAVCDAYDAITTTRPYRAASGHEDALAELRRCAGSQFDPRVVAAFERIMSSPPAERADSALGLSMPQAQVG